MNQTSQQLEKKLKAHLQGEVSFSSSSRALYSVDASNYRQIPIGVVIPKSTDDLIRAVEICREFSAPILPRGAGTSLAGQCCNVAVVLDTSKYLNQILEINPVARTARVQPGIVLDDLQAAIKPLGLMFGPDPATHNRCTIGGMIGNNACGVHSILAGKTVENILELDVLTYDGLRIKAGQTNPESLQEKIKKGGREGDIYRGLQKIAFEQSERIKARYPNIPRRVSGYNLNELLPENKFNVARALVGTEGTCALFLEATLKLIPYPSFRRLVVMGFSDIFSACDAVPEILALGPIGLEGMDEFFVRNMKKKNLHLSEINLLPEGEAWLLVEMGGFSNQEVAEKSEKLLKAFAARKSISFSNFEKESDQKKIWAIREATFGASVFIPGEKDTYAGFEDSAVHPDQLGAYMRELRKLFEKYGYSSITYGHFGDGCIHSRVSFDLRSDAGIQTYKAFMDEASDLVLKFGGSFSGEHGDGQTWGHYLPKMFGPELVQAFWDFKKIWDPEEKMNPGKVVHSYALEDNLKLKNYKTISQPSLNFSYSEDEGHFGRTTERCIGLGKCLKQDTGTMCPSFMATHDEKHSTRGRAHLLHEMIRGDVMTQGWKDPEIHDAMSLCLSCKACKTECPVGVDMAAYKAEFMAQYYQGRRRPLKAVLFGHIDFFLPIAQKLSGSVNFLSRQRWFKSILEKVLGISKERELPVVAKKSFRNQFKTSPNASQKVILWVDTFSNYFYPEILSSAVGVLEEIGFEVLLHEKNLCCGRPLYDFGMLGQAKSKLQKILDAFEKEEDETPVLVLEPGCASVFKDELLQFFPKDERAKRFRERVYLLAEFLEKKAPQKSWDLRGKTVLMQGHCHQKSLIGMKADENLLRRCGAQPQILDSGCCGMAGSFGFEKKHAEVSRKIGERVLLPAIRQASEDTEILADGFSCREQMRLAGKRARHLAELLNKS